MHPAKDITETFTAAASALPLGELVQDDYFTLAESVGALEIMDPKMDSGLLESGESLEPDFDVGKTLSPEQVLWLMDRLMCSEAAWHQGNPLAQTVFSSLYIDNLLWPVSESVAQAIFKPKRDLQEGHELLTVVLRAYCCGLVKACDYVHSRITKEQYYEDEDFSSQLHNRTLLSAVPVEDIIELIVDAQFYIDGAQSIDGNVRQALKSRLQLRSVMLEAMSQNPTSSPQLLQLSFGKCHEILMSIKKSSSLGVPVADSFSAKVQRKLISSTPPRPIVEISYEDAISDFTRLCSDAQDATAVLQCSTAGGVLKFILVFMARPQQPNVFVRCLLQSLVFSDKLFLGSSTTREFIFNDLNRLVLGENVLTDLANDAAEAPQSSRYQIAKSMNQFATSMGHAHNDLMRCLCMNRSRMRRLLAHTLGDWENLQFETEDIDGRLHEFTHEVPLIDRLSTSREEIWSYPLSSWTYVYKLKQMEWIVQQGFELGVYLPDEFSSMFWYLRYLADVEAQHLNRIATFARRSYGFLKAPSKAQSERFELTFATLDYAMGEAGATVSFAECLSHLYKALVLLGLLPFPPRPYSNASLRHSLRLKPFLSVSLPPVPSEAELEAAIETGTRMLSTEDSDASPEYSSMLRASSLLDMADESCRMARKEWDALVKCDPEAAQSVGFEDAWQRKTKDILKSVVATGIAIAGVRKVIADMQATNESKASHLLTVSLPDRGYHEWWPVPSIKSC